MVGPTRNTVEVRRGLLLFAIIVAVLFLKSPVGYLNPVLCCEDGRDLFAHYYGTPTVTEIFQSYGVVSYLALGSTALAWMISLFPVIASAHLYAFVSLLIAALTYFSLSTPGLRHVIPDRALRVGAILVILVLPLGNHALQTSVAYSQFNLLLLLCFLTLTRPTRGRLGQWVLSITMALLAWCHPQTPVLVPIFVIRLVGHGWRNRLMWVPPLVSCLAYFVYGMHHGPIRATAVHYRLLSTLLAERSALEGLLGTNARMWMREWELAGWMHLSGLALLALPIVIAIWLAWKRRLSADEFLTFGAMAYLVVAITLTAIAARPNHSILETDGYQRHLYIPRVLYVLGLASVLTRVWTEPWSRKRITQVSAAFAVTFVLALTVAYDNRDRFQLDSRRGAEVRRYLDFVSRLESVVDRCDSAFIVTLPRGTWSIQLRVGSDLKPAITLAWPPGGASTVPRCDP